MGQYQNENKIRIAEQIRDLTTRKEAIEALINHNSTPEQWRELSQIIYRLECAESHLNGTFGKDSATGEHLTRVINL